MGVNWGGGASGAVAGAASGSAIMPGWGTAIGAVAGGVMGLFGGGKKKAKKRSTLDPQQKALYGDYINSLRGEGPFSDLYNFDEKGYNDVFDKTIGRPAYRNFQENVIPGITGQFRNNNIMNSSYTGEALGRAGRNVQEGLDAQRSANVFQGQQQANQNKQNSINNILGMTTFDYEKPNNTPGTIDQILGSIGADAGSWLKDYLKKGSGGSSFPTGSISTPN